MKSFSFKGLTKILCLFLAITVFMVGCGKNITPTSGSSGDSSQASQTDGLTSTETSGSESTKETTSTASSSIGSNTTTKTKKPTTVSKISTTTKREVDLKGRVIKIGSVYGEEYNQEIGKSPYSDLFRQKEKEIENKFNCKIQYSRIAPDSCESIIANAVKAGEAPYDLVECDIASARNLARTKTLLDQKTLKSLKLNDKRFIKAVNDSFTFNGKVYGSGFENLSITGVLFNKRIIREKKQPDIYKLYDEGKWTFEAFEQIAKATTSPYKPDKTRDVYGITGSTNIMGLALTSNAGATVSRNKSGKYIIDMALEKGVYAMNWCRKLMFEDGSYDYSGTDWKSAVNRFAEGKATFLPFYAWIARDLSRTMVDDIGFVAFPKGPGQNTYINSLYGGKAYVFPKTVKNPEDIAKVYYAVVSASSQLWNVIVQEYKGWGFDDKSFEIFRDLAEKYSRPEYSVGPDYSGFSRDMNDSVFKRTGNPASVMASVKSKFQKATDDYYKEFS